MKRLIAFCLLLSSILPGVVWAFEEPAFQLLEKSSAIETRLYKPALIAEVEVEGNFTDAFDHGFKILADYILGKNIAKTQPESEKIAMTAPFLIQAGGEHSSAAKDMANDAKTHWRVQFFMPEQYTAANLPTPTDSRVIIRTLPAKKVVALVFSGWASEDRINRKTEDLWHWVSSKNLKTVGTVQLARYNVPWTVPFWRRNELWIEIE